MWNTRLDESQAGIKTAGRNINKLRYANDTLMEKGKNELKSLLMKVKEKRAGLKLNIQKTKIMAYRWGKLETVAEFIFLGSKITADGDCTMKLKDAYPLEGKLWPT